MNRGELKSFKNFETVQNSMLPGLYSEAPISGVGSPEKSPLHYRKSHILAPPLKVDNSLTNL